MAVTVRTPNRLGSGCGVLFLLPFLLVGLVMLGFSGWRMMEWLGMRTWQPTPATITRLVQTRGDDTLGIEAEYNYQWQGRPYQGTRVGVHGGGTDNIGSFQTRTYDRLRAFEGKPGAAECFVNPADPAVSVLDRDPRWEMFAFMSVFSTLFGSIGLLGITGIFVARRRRRGKRGSGQPSADDGLTEIESEASPLLPCLFMAACWWTLAAIPPGRVAFHAVSEGRWGALAGFLPAIVALAILKSSVRLWRQSAGSARMTLQLPQCPLPRGTTTMVALVIDPRVYPAGPVRFSLLPVAADGEEAVVKERESTVENPETQVLGDQLVIALPVTIPAKGGSRGSGAWKLKVEVPVVGRRTSLNATFVVPTAAPAERSMADSAS